MLSRDRFSFGPSNQLCAECYGMILRQLNYSTVSITSHVKTVQLVLLIIAAILGC